MTNELIEAIYDKDRVRKVAKETQTAEEWAIAKRARNDVKTALRREKADFIRVNAERYEGD